MTAFEVVFGIGILLFHVLTTIAVGVWLNNTAKRQVNEGLAQLQQAVQNAAMAFLSSQTPAPAAQHYGVGYYEQYPPTNDNTIKEGQTV